MRIVFDLQACQTSSSRNRGIGRYSLALMKAIAARSRDHDIWLALNGRFESTVEALKHEFAGIIPREQIVTFQGPRGVAQSLEGNKWRIRAAEILRHRFLSELNPDIVHTASVVEGLGEDAVIGPSAGSFLAAATIYDLIPLVYSNVYLQSDVTRHWYYRRLQQLKSSDILLAISDHTRKEAIDYLKLSDDQIFNISAGVDPSFIKQAVSPHTQSALRARLGLHRSFVMYTGGVDFRKNLEGLVEAYAALPYDVRQHRQLAIVCSITDGERSQLKKVAEQHGLQDNELVLTGYVSHDDLVALYNICELFVFPSLSEGFGLPVLEAMACGAPVIASDRSSIPEVLGCPDALFDPLQPTSFVGKLAQALIDSKFRASLQAHSTQQFGQFTWDRSADRSLDAFEQTLGRRPLKSLNETSWNQRFQQTFHSQTTSTSSARTSSTQAFRRPRLAYVSPILPVKSGIANYSSELLPDLAKHYDINLIVDQPGIGDPWLSANFPVRTADWFKQNVASFDRIVYQMGNSSFHGYMFDLIDRYPGVVALHDFYLSGVIDWFDQVKLKTGFLSQELFQAHGFAAVVSEDPIVKFPANKSVIDAALGMIVHSQHSVDLSKSWYANHSDEDWALVPQVRMPNLTIPRPDAKAALGFDGDAFLISCFGIVHATKQNELLLDAFLASQLAKNPRCYLLMVGDGFEAPYLISLQNRATASVAAERIKFTGFVDSKTFDLYLQATDIAVQLRQMSRGETSRTALDAMSTGIPLIVNACGSMKELPDDCVVKLPERLSVQDLTLALEMLWLDGNQRQSRLERAQKWVQMHHHPVIAANAYHGAIERFYTHGARARHLRMLADVMDATIDDVSAADMAEVTSCVAQSFTRPKPRILVDLTEIDQGALKSSPGVALTKAILSRYIYGVRTEPIQFIAGDVASALTRATGLFGIDALSVADYRVEITAFDVLIIHDPVALDKVLARMLSIRTSVGKLYLALSDSFLDSDAVRDAGLQSILQLSDAVVCQNEMLALRASELLNTHKARVPVGFINDAPMPRAESMFTWVSADTPPRTNRIEQMERN